MRLLLGTLVNGLCVSGWGNQGKSQGAVTQVDKDLPASPAKEAPRAGVGGVWRAREATPSLSSPRGRALWVGFDSVRDPGCRKSGLRRRHIKCMGWALHKSTQLREPGMLKSSPHPPARGMEHLLAVFPKVLEGPAAAWTGAVNCSSPGPRARGPGPDSHSAMALQMGT